MHMLEDKYGVDAAIDSVSLIEKPGYYYSKGWYEIVPDVAHGEWMSLWVRPSKVLAETVRPHMCDREIGQVAFHRWPDGRMVAIFLDRKMIASVAVELAGNVPEFLIRK